MFHYHTPINHRCSIRPKLSGLTKEEFNAVRKSSAKGPKKLSKREKTNRKYMRMLAPYEKGGYVEMKLKKSESKQTEKLRPNRAAAEMVLTLVFKRTRGHLRFEVKK